MRERPLTRLFRLQSLGLYAALRVIAKARARSSNGSFGLLSDDGAIDHVYPDRPHLPGSHCRGLAVKRAVYHQRESCLSPMVFRGHATGRLAPRANWRTTVLSELGR